MLLSLTCTCGTPYKNTDVSTAAIVACKCAGIENLASLARARDVGNSNAVHYVQCIRSRGCNAYVKSGQKEDDGSAFQAQYLLTRPDLQSSWRKAET